MSLNVLNPGEIAATGGTSGVVYGVNGKVNYDTLSRVNTFAHVNHSADQTRLGVLIMYQRCGNPQFMGEAECGSGRYKLSCFERVGGDRSDRFGGPLDSAFRERCGAYVTEQAGELLHSRAEFRTFINKAHIARAAQEGIVFSFKYGMDIMNEMGIDIGVIRAGNANLFFKPYFPGMRWLV